MRTPSDSKDLRVDKSVRPLCSVSLLLILGLVVVISLTGVSPNSADPQSTFDSAQSATHTQLLSMQAAARAWTVPLSPDLIATARNARSSCLKSDGATDNTAALQSLLNSLPAGSKLYFPAGTYRIDGPISITKPMTLFGEPGTIFNCQKAKYDVFTINGQGSRSSVLSDVTITGLVIEGPGIETDPIMIRGHYLQNFNVAYVKFHNVGREAIDIRTCTDVLIEDCVFDNVFYPDEGYGVAICDRSDRIVVRDSFFVTKGRHGVMTGTANYNLPVADYVRSVTVENNYFENMPSHAIDAHAYMIGPYTIKGNVIYNCNNGIGVSSGECLITDNVIIDCDHGMDVRDPSNNANNKNDVVQNNKLINIDGEYAFYLMNSNAIIRNNIATGDGGAYAVVLGPYSPHYCIVEGNIFDNFHSNGIHRLNPGAEVTSVDNCLKSRGMFIKF
jgi:polygalacturonase